MSTPRALPVGTYPNKIGVTLSVTQYAALEELASRKGMTKNALIRRWIELGTLIEEGRVNGYVPGFVTDIAKLDVVIQEIK